MTANLRRSGGRALVPALLVALAVLASACAHQPPPVKLLDPPGFFHGLLHGFVVLFSLVGSIFTDVRIYAFPNSGFWYDVGFFIGASAALGGGAHASGRRGRG